MVAILQLRAAYVSLAFILGQAQELATSKANHLESVSAKQNPDPLEMIQNIPIE